MPFDRFYCAGELKGKVLLHGQELHHLQHVMRIVVGEEVELVNGNGTLAHARVSAFKKEAVELEVTHTSHEPRPARTVSLAVPLMRPAKLELVLEKGTELGADAFVLYPADGSEKSDLSANALERLRYVTVSALKQSGRLYLPSIAVVRELDEVVAREGTLWFGDTRPEAPWLQPQPEKQVTLITGPEKGFSEREVALLEKKAQGVRLSPNILRAETAPMAGLAILCCGRVSG